MRLFNSQGQQIDFNNDGAAPGENTVGFDAYLRHAFPTAGTYYVGVSGFGNDGESGFEGCRLGRAIGTYLHGPLLPRNPWLADWLLAQAIAHRSGGEPPELAPLADDLESRAHEVSAARARTRGGKS